MIAHPTAPATRTKKRTVAAVFLPVIILIAAAIVTNFGGGVARDAAAANSIGLSATILTNNHITNTCGTAGTVGTLALGSIAANTPANASCTVQFGSTNSTATLNLAATATNLAFAGFTAIGGVCATPAAGQIGISTTAASTATSRVAPYNCATGGQVVSAPTSAAPFCTSAAGADRTCIIYVGLHTGTVTAGAKSGTITQSLT